MVHGPHPYIPWNEETGNTTCVNPEGGQGVRTPQLVNHKAIGLLSDTDPDPLENHKPTKTAFNIGPLSARQRNAIKMAFRWWDDDGPLLVYLNPLSAHQLKKKNKVKFELDPSDKTFSIHACTEYFYIQSWHNTTPSMLRNHYDAYR